MYSIFLLAIFMCISVHCDAGPISTSDGTSATALDNLFPTGNGSSDRESKGNIFISLPLLPNAQRPINRPQTTTTSGGSTTPVIGSTTTTSSGTMTSTTTSTTPTTTSQSAIIIPDPTLSTPEEMTGGNTIEPVES